MSSAAFLSSKCTKIAGGWGFAPDSIGELTALPAKPLAGFKGDYFKAPTIKGIGGKGGGEVRGDAKMIHAPGARNPGAATAATVY